MKKYRVLLVLVVSLLLLDIYAFSNSIKTREYRILSEKISNPVKIVFLSDLHGAEFGRENKKLVSLITEQQPDLICITGDLVDRSKDTLQIAERLIRQLSNIAPLYVSMGNHEYEYSYCDLETIKEVYQEAGAVLVDYDYYDLAIKENPIRIGGFYGYGCPYKGMIPKEKDSLYLADCQDTDTYKILLAHMPHGWYHAGSLDFWAFDLVLCGHTHGGQIRLPLIGGLYAPDMGYFPGKEMGVYKSDDSTKSMVLSTGLGNTEWVPRINNRPEVAVVQLEPEA